MPQYADTLQSMTGVVRRIKQTASPETVRDMLNFRMRALLDQRPFWSGMIQHKIIAIPNAYTTGSIAMNLGSQVVTGTATAWPVSDVVNSIIIDDISNVGAQRVTPASMDGITEDTILYVDSAGTPETVAVQQVFPNSFIATFQYVHNASATITCSSLSGRQLRLTNKNPIFSILSVVSATSMIVDQPWGAESFTGSAYQLVKMFITIDPKIKMVMHCIDTVLIGWELEVNVSQGRLMALDPWRQNTGDPIWLVDNESNFNRNFQYELYPPPTTQRQYTIIYSTQWPDMQQPGDRPVPFLSGSVLVDGALSSLLRVKLEESDPYYDPRAADHYEKKWLEATNTLIYSDQHKSQMALSFAYRQAAGGYGGGANWAQSHLAGDEYW